MVNAKSIFPWKMGSKRIQYAPLLLHTQVYKKTISSLQFSLEYIENFSPMMQHWYENFHSIPCTHFVHLVRHNSKLMWYTGHKNASMQPFMLHIDARGMIIKHIERLEEFQNDRVILNAQEGFIFFINSLIRHQYTTVAICISIFWYLFLYNCTIKFYCNLLNNFTFISYAYTSYVE